MVEAAGDLPVRWLDARRLLYRDGRTLRVVDFETKRTREVLSVAPDKLNGFALSPEGRTLYVARGPEESDIWMAELKEPATQP